MRWIAAPLLALVCACSDDIDDPEAAEAFLTRLRSENYQGWQRAKGWEARKPSISAHGDDADIFVNKTLADTPGGSASWPTGSIIVKDSYRGGSLRLIGAMEKRADGWYFVEWSGDGSVKYAGRPSICTNCHQNGQDEVLAFGLPQ